LVLWCDSTVVSESHQGAQYIAVKLSMKVRTSSPTNIPKQADKGTAPINVIFGGRDAIRKGFDYFKYEMYSGMSWIRVE
jgi:hypothetical protein